MIPDTLSSMDAKEKVRENRLRRKAQRQGLTLTTNGRRDPDASDYLTRYRIEPGPSGLTLDDVEAVLSTPRDSRTAGDLSLLALSARVQQFTGHIEDMDDDERVWLLGLFAGGVLRLRAVVREQWERNSRDGYMEALPPLGALAAALGDDGFEAWAEGLEE